MRKFVLMVLAGMALMLSAPQFASAAPVGLGTGIAAAADQVSTIDAVRYRRWHHRHWRGHYRWRHRHWRWHHRWYRHHWRYWRWHRHWHYDRWHHRHWGWHHRHWRWRHW